MLGTVTYRRSSLRYYAVLGAMGAMSPQDAANSVMPQSSIKSTAGFTETVWNQLVESASSGSIYYNPSGCSGVSSSNNLSLVKTASGMALSGAQIGMTAAGVSSVAFGAVTFGISALVGLFTIIESHHAQAVAKEQQTECPAIAAANNYLQIIEQGVSSGEYTPAEGIAALQSLQSDFNAALAGITKNSSSQCNAGCVWEKELATIVAYKTSQYQDMAAQQAATPAPKTSTAGSGPTVAAPVTSGSTLQTAVPGTQAAPAPVATSPASAAAAPATVQPAATSSLPTWWPIAAIAVVALLAFEVL